MLTNGRRSDRNTFMNATEIANQSAASQAKRDRKRRINNLLNAACKRNDIVSARRWKQMLDAV